MDFHSASAKDKCIPFTCETAIFLIFPHRQYVNGIVIKCSLKCTWLRGRSWHLREIC